MILPWDAVAVLIAGGLTWLLSPRGGLSEGVRRVLGLCAPPVLLALAVAVLWHLYESRHYDPAPVGQPPGILLAFAGGVGVWLTKREGGGLKTYGIAACLLLPVGLLLCFAWAEAR